MAFASGLRESLQLRASRVESEFSRGASLEEVLSADLMAVEAMAEGDLIASILLLSADRKRLSHGAAPRLPRSYREAIDGVEIGPRAGSCGTAAYSGKAVYVTDIASDPLWADYRHLALPHGLRSCWSTPIRDKAGTVIGTFAIYHRTVSGPSSSEIEAIELITDHVAEAIMWAREAGLVREPLPAQARRANPGAHNDPGVGIDRLQLSLRRLEELVEDLARLAQATDSMESKAGLNNAVDDIHSLLAAVRQQINRHEQLDR